MNDKWLNDMKRHLDSYETDAPEGLWEGIESALSEPKAPATPTLQQTTVPSTATSSVHVVRPWLRVAAAAAILATIIIGADLLLLHDDHLDPIDSRLAAIGSQHAAKESPMAANESQTAANESQMATVTGSRQAPKPTPAPPSELSEPSESSELSEQSESSEPSAPQHTSHPLPTPDRLPDAGRGKGRGKSRYYAAATPRRQNTGTGRISIGINTGSGFIVDIDSHDYDYDNFNIPYDSPSQIFATNKLTDCLNVIKSPEPSFNPRAESATHSLPIHVAATVSYAVTDRLSLESGLTFTSLHSDVTYSSNSYSAATGRHDRYNSWSGDRKLFYLGIPLTARYTIASGSSFDFYGAGGFTVEKCVAGNTRIYCTDSEFRNADPRSFTSRVDPLQWSVRASLGVQWRITSQLGLYAEPGVSYYFNNHSDASWRALPISTYYTEHPFNISISVGMRLMLPR